MPYRGSRWCCSHWPARPLAARFGWIETSVAALLLSAPLLAFGGSNVGLIVVGMLLFQMTMPVTVSAIGLVHPDRPAFAFGIACLALVLGALPTFYGSVRVHYGPLAFVLLSVLSTASVYGGLRLLGARYPTRRRWRRLRTA